jgi:hypothetical protein
MNQGSSIDLTAGEEVTIELTGTEWNGYYTRPGVWMDVSLDNQFQAAECVVDPSSYTIGATATTFKVKVPKAHFSYKTNGYFPNAGDIFRLHKEEYVKITIAGKGLKLYMALNPEDYKDGPIPVDDASDKKIYKEILKI